MAKKPSAPAENRESPIERPQNPGEFIPKLQEILVQKSEAIHAMKKPDETSDQERLEITKPIVDKRLELANTLAA